MPHNLADPVVIASNPVQGFPGMVEANIW